MKRYLLLALVIFCLIQLLLGSLLVATSFMSFDSIEKSAGLPTDNGYSVRSSRQESIPWSRAIGFFLIACGLILIFLEKKVVAWLEAEFRKVPNYRERLSYYRHAWKQEDRSHRWLLYLAILAAVAVRLFFLNQPVRADEAFTFSTFASKPLSVGLTYYPVPNNHVFNTFLIHLVHLVLGDDPRIIRLPAFVSGVLTVPLAYLAGRKMFNKNTGLIAASLVATSSYLIEYSTNARGYMILTFIFLLLILVGGAIIEKGRVDLWMWFVLLSALGFFTVPSMLYCFGAVVLWIFLSRIRRRPEARGGDILREAAKLASGCVFVGLLTANFYTPLMCVSGVSAVVNNGIVRASTMNRLSIELPGSLSETWQLWNRDIPFLLVAFFVLFFAASLYYYQTLEKDRINLVYAVVAWSLLILIGQKATPFPRIWLPFLPVYLISVAGGLYFFIDRLARLEDFTSEKFREKNIVFAMVLAAVLLMTACNVITTRSVYYSEETGTLTDVVAIVSDLKGELREGDVVWSSPSVTTILEYYFKRNGVPPGNYRGGEDSGGQAGRTFMVFPESLFELVGPIESSNPDVRLFRVYDSAKVYVLEDGSPPDLP